MSRRERPTWTDRLVYEALLAGVQITRDLPLGVALALADRVGRELFGLWTRRREIAMVNLAVAFPALSRAQRARIGRASFGNLARQWVEFVRLPQMSREELEGRVAIEGLEHLVRARAEGRGVLLLTAHLGSWELLAHALGVLDRPISVLARRLDNPLLDAWVRRVRRRCGNRVLYRDGASREIVDLLRKSRETVGLLADQHVQTHEGIEARLFGRTVSNSRLLPLLALLTGAPVVPVCIARQPSGLDHVIRVRAPLAIARTGDPDEDLAATAQRCADAVEAMVREHPDQWMWGHRRWKNVPEIARRYARPAASARLPEPAARES